ncbi:MAG: Sensory box histidine kinase/response regulator [Myxococcaceae bacterium]|nr:Sensory box histidine kinase/response regulator [Myxococcaceae bacterium]
MKMTCSGVIRPGESVSFSAMGHAEDLATECRVADELPVAIWLGRVPSGETVYVNAAFRAVLGMDPPADAAAGDYVGPYGIHTHSGEKYPEERMPFPQVLATRALVVVDDLVVHRHDGKRVYLRVFARPLFDDAGTITHVLEAFTDITREIESEKARVEGERRLHRAQRLESIGNLVGGFAHDFNNLLTVTKLVISRLRTTEKDAERKHALDQVDQVTTSAVGLIRNLLGFAGRGRNVAAPVSLEEVVQSIVVIAERTFDRRIALRTDLSANGGVVLGDTSQLEQVTMNLVLNARDAIAGKGEVVVRTRVASLAANEANGCEAGDYVMLEVSDTGTGIDPSIRDRVFEPYFTTKTLGPVKGTGLGLATVHGIVQSHHGFVEIVDNVPRGTTMRLGIPRHRGKSELAGASAGASSSPSANPAESRARTNGKGKTPHDGSRRVLLLVDDEPLVRASTAQTLTELGYRVIEAEDGARAITIFRERSNEISAVVLDMLMPNVGGKECYAGLREVKSDVPVLLITGCAMNEDVRALLDLGVIAWLEKPYDDTRLAESLASLGLGSSQLV